MTMLISTRDARKENLIVLCVSLSGSAAKMASGGYSWIIFIENRTVDSRKGALLPKPVVMTVPALYSQVWSKQLQLKWHVGHTRLSLLVAPVQADEAQLNSCFQVLNSCFCIQITQSYFSIEPHISWLKQVCSLCCWCVTNAPVCLLKP